MINVPFRNGQYADQEQETIVIRDQDMTMFTLSRYRIPARSAVATGTLLGLASLLLAGCAPPAYTVRPSAAPPPPPPSVEIYFYPTKGQSKQQQERDRYECYLWAVKQTGFDPGQSQLAPHQRVEVVPTTPPGSDVAAGAVTGAVVGSVMSRPRDSGTGMVFGAIAGAMLGAASEQAKQEQAARIQQQYDARDAESYARLDRQARDYRRAMTACLEGRGYTVR